MGLTPRNPESGDVLTLLVPHGWATQLPWHALPMGAGAEVLGDARPIAYLPTASWVLEANGSPGARDRRVAAVNLAPDPGGAGLEVGQQDLARELGRLWTALGKQSGPDLDGSSSTVPALLEQLHACRGGVAVLSYHGCFERDYAFLSRLVVNGREILTADALLRAGGLDLDLLVLVACRTAVSVALPGDDLLGFGQTSLIAGARTVVAAQWELPLLHGVALARLYLERVLGGEDKVRALWRARKDLRDRPEEAGLGMRAADLAADPFYNAGLIVMGSP